MLAISRRIYEDNMALKHFDINGCTEDGSNRSFFPNGFADHIFSASMWNRELDYEAELEDYFSHIYGEDWRLVKEYLENISASFDHAYLCGDRSADIARGELYNPEHAKDLEKVKELTAGIREVIKTHMVMPVRAQTVCWRVLLRHAEWSDLLSEVFIEKCKGNNEEALARFDVLIETFGNYDMELERYFDFGLAIQSLQNILKKRPKIEL
jgi:transcriptional regulator of met regulon